ncbi:MAG TPA: spore cortex-lytic enzyme [Clostridia bacterium]|nr:spore cortex-lytic enzyme [Clostridia bacterium]
MDKRWITRIIAVIIVATGVLTVFVVKSDSKALVKYGSRGEEVKTVQKKLQALGLYNAAIDGIAGSKTVAAIKQFQKQKGLKVDGIVGPATAAALGIDTPSNPTSNSDLYLLARTIYSEARGEPYIGQVAVGAVIMNRVKHPNFPNTISGVIYQPGAFTAVSDGQINLIPDTVAIKAAREAMNGSDPTRGCIYYYNPATATNKWILTRPVIYKFGKHNFCI